MKEKRQQKQIIELTSLTRQKLTDTKAIQEGIIQFYKSLMGTSAYSLPVVNKTTMSNGPVLSHHQQVELCKEITNQEILEGLQSIGDDKALGIDGFNALFYKKSWPIIAEYTCAAVHEFFNTTSLYKAVSCILITLLPKVPNP
ncbi:uncharacterized protein LOC132643909 [Lycium barbarum]|uniref:uncharacterized protein LOC132643909 n=1 Tax=Lycium barbarum TaxID=112863 RepID=UPI00293E9EB8|nr:uncharacterized protein LOC132643909 [Lycium barbarum]